jgi:ABC-2 type transport system permease protein
VIRTFAFITFASFKNRVISRVRRLRQPRYLVSTLAGLAYLWFVSFRHFFANASRQRLVMTGIGADLASVVLLALMIGAWALPGDKGGLEFSEAEIQFLFPAPLHRRQLLLYKIIKAQLPALFTSIVLAVVGFRRSNFVGVWLMFGVLSIYFILAALGRARLRLAGIGFFARVAIVTVTLAAISWFLSVQFGEAGFAASLRTLNPRNPIAAAATVDQPFRRPAVAALLFIPRIFANTAFPTSLLQLATYGSAVIGMGVLFFFIATRLNVSFEDASIASSQARFERREKMRDQQAGRFVRFKRLPPPFTLKPEHGPLVAIFWKNFIAALRISSAWITLLVTPFMVIALKSLSGSDFFSASTALLCLVMCAVIPLFAPDIFRQDLRYDLVQAEVLKSFPISGERLVIAEMAAPLFIVAALELVLLTFTSVVMHFTPSTDRFTFFSSPQFIVVAMLFAVPICAAQLLIRNAVAVYFPAWAVRSKENVGGFVAMGQRIIILAGNLLVLSGLLIPAAIIFLPALWIAYHFFGGSSLVLGIATLPSAALLIGEVWFGIHLVGQRFEALDASNEIQV